MNKKQIFDQIVEKCASVCGVSAQEIKSTTRRADVIDARCMAFHFATKEGFTPRDIATLLGKHNPKAIRALCNSFEMRCKRSYLFRDIASILRSQISRGGVFSAEQ